MATLPADDLRLIEGFGPHLSTMTDLRLSTSVEPDRLVKTHCCFCGQQCGIQLKVRDNEVIGFEPWEEFPFNRGMLCPKGVKRYLQGSHPDRLITALRRDPSAAHGFSPMGYDDAVARVASEIDRIQRAHGRQAVAVLSGASLTTEKTYLLGKFARVCLRTPYIDYNGRLCMVSAGAANKKAFGIDRTTNPWSDMVGTDVIIVVLQLWLLTATMNAWLGGDDSVVWPAAAVSAGGLALNVGLLSYLGRIERTRKAEA
jgi:assimilatory nitrate reductase catalytic subunit